MAALHALLVDARTAGPADSGLHPHEPFMAFNAEDYGDHSGYSVTAGPDAQGNYIGKCALGKESPLDKESLSIQTGGKTSLTLPAPVFAKIPAKTGEERSLTWVPKLKLLNHSCLDFGKLHPDCVSQLRNVVAKVTFTNGHFRSLSLGRQRDKATNNYIKWDFKVNTNGPVIHDQALADTVCVELNVPQDTVTIESSSQNKTLELKPPKYRDTITLTIGNFPTEPHLKRPNQIDHFQWYYELLETPPHIAQRPIPFIPSIVTERLRTASGNFCPLVGGG